MPPRRVESKPSQTTNGKVGQQKSEKQQAKNEHLPKKTLTRPDSPLTVADKVRKISIAVRRLPEWTHLPHISQLTLISLFAYL